MPLASIAMYVSPPPIAQATRLFWQALGQRLRELGLDAPVGLDEETPHNDAWLRPDLIFGQVCGYPYIRTLRGKVQLVATPIYGLPGCEGVRTGSFIIVGAGSQARSIADLRGSRAAINEPGSNTGANLFRHTVALFAVEGRFFSSVIETGGHLMSIDAIAGGRADVAAIDCITFGNTLRFDPGRVAGVRILMETAKGPGLPFITAASTPAEDLAILRRALQETVADPVLAEVRDTLSLRGISLLDDADYERLAELEREAVALGYPILA